MDIKQVRKQMGLTQKAFAALIGVAPFTVRRWESGAYQPSKLAQENIKKLTPCS
jgi:DNA-binding transcriptional regulator YiaG